MPSPFPGMDPYLEGDDWTSFHTSLATEISRQLTPQLRPKYVALSQERFDVADEGAVAIETIYPDVGVAELEPSLGETMGEAAIAAPCVLETVMEARVPHTWVEIRGVAGRSLVTTIEILSPWNKRAPGRDEYLEKRRKLLRSASHLIELDLLRRGQRLPMRDPLPPAAYYVLVGRAEERPRMQVWPIALNQRLPTFPVPLLTGDADAALNLQSSLENVYDLGGFDLVLDYSKPPSVPLRGKHATWAAERLRASRDNARGK